MKPARRGGWKARVIRRAPPVLAVLAVVATLTTVAALVLGPDTASEGPRAVPATVAAATDLSPAAVVARVARPVLSGHALAAGYAGDLELAALDDFARAADDPALARTTQSLIARALARRQGHQWWQEPFVSLGWTRARDGDGAARSAFLADTARMLAEAPRTADGLIAFHEGGDRIPLAAGGLRPLLADHAQEVVARLARASALSGDAAPARAAAAQALGTERALRDARSGLWAHARGWSSANGALTATHWGRAQGWAMTGLAGALEVLPPASAEAAAVRGPFVRLAAALVRYQGADGLWRQVVDDPRTFAETSASGMIVAALARGVAHGDLPADPYGGAARRGWAGLLAHKVAADGTVFGAVSGTPPLPATALYRTRATPVNDPHGVAAVMMAAGGLARLDRTAR